MLSTCGTNQYTLGSCTKCYVMQHWALGGYLKSVCTCIVSMTHWCVKSCDILSYIHVHVYWDNGMGTVCVSSPVWLLYLQWLCEATILRPQNEEVSSHSFHLWGGGSSWHVHWYIYNYYAHYILGEMLRIVEWVLTIIIATSCRRVQYSTC